MDEQAKLMEMVLHQLDKRLDFLAQRVDWLWKDHERTRSELIQLRSELSQKIAALRSPNTT